MKPTIKKSLKLLTLLISSILIATASAAAYVTLQWQTTATVSTNPKVCFIQWSNGQKYNTFSYSVGIFPSITTVDENITYGIYNWDNQMHNVYFRLASENTNSTDVAWLYFKIYTTSDTKYTSNITNFDAPSTDWSNVVQLDSNTKYSIYIAIKAGSSAVAGHTPQFTFEIKVDNP